MSDHTERLYLTDTERTIADALDGFDERHSYPVETDDGPIWRCKCGATPPSHLLGAQVDEAFWLWQHHRTERARFVAARVAARVAAADREIADLRSRLACVDEATWWDRGYEERIAAIRGMCDLTTNGMTSTDDGEQTKADAVAAARADERARLVDRLRDIVATPDDKQWWPVEPYTDPVDDDEVVEVQVINADRLRAMVEAADQ